MGTRGRGRQTTQNRPSWLRWIASALPPLIFVALALPVFSQELIEAGHQPSSSPPEVTVPAEFSSARATMATFLEAFYIEGGADLDQAASCLDLSMLPVSIRMARGRELAAQLKDVFDRTLLIDLDQISSEPLGPPWELPVEGGNTIVLDRQDDQRWLFTAATVEALGRMQAEVQDRDVVEGVVETVGIVTTSQWLRSNAPSSLRGQALYLEGWQWIGLLLLTVAGIAVGRLVVAGLQGPMMLWLGRWAREVDSELVRRALNPIGALAMILLWLFGISWLGLPLAALRWFATLVEVVLIFTAAVTAYRLVSVLGDVLDKRGPAIRKPV